METDTAVRKPRPWLWRMQELSGELQPNLGSRIDLCISHFGKFGSLKRVRLIWHLEISRARKPRFSHLQCFLAGLHPAIAWAANLVDRFSYRPQDKHVAIRVFVRPWGIASFLGCKSFIIVKSFRGPGTLLGSVPPRCGLGSTVWPRSRTDLFLFKLGKQENWPRSTWIGIVVTRCSSVKLRSTGLMQARNKQHGFK